MSGSYNLMVVNAHTIPVSESFFDRNVEPICSTHVRKYTRRAFKLLIRIEAVIELEPTAE